MKRSMILLVGMISLILAGCGNSIYPKEILWAIDVCKNNGGVHVITAYEATVPKVKCKNGASFKSNQAKVNRYKEKPL